MTVSLAADMVKGKRSILGKLAKHLTCRHFVIIAFTVGLLLVTSLPAATKIPTLEVDDVVKVLVDRAESVKSYRAKLLLGSRFLSLYAPSLLFWSTMQQR